jgi:RimJ/RimL family protein N-acetyltransferase
MHNAFAIGRTVYLRPLEREDAGLVQPWLNDPEVTRTLRTQGPLSQYAENAYIERILQSQNDLIAILVRRAGDVPVGVAGLHQMDFKARHAVFGITIGVKEAWGQGFGTEATFLLLRHAFETLNLNRVWLQVYDYNTRGLRTYEKLGFQKEGLLRQDCYREGRYWDTILMGLLRAEWEAVNARMGPLCVP